VPFRDYTGIDGDALRSMTAAYDAAIEKMHLKSSDPLTGKLAATIAALVSEGERDPQKLCERALAQLHKEPAWRQRRS